MLVVDLGSSDKGSSAADTVLQVSTSIGGNIGLTAVSCSCCWLLSEPGQHWEAVEAATGLSTELHSKHVLGRV